MSESAEGTESWEAKFNAAKTHFHNYPYVWYSYATVCEKWTFFLPLKDYGVSCCGEFKKFDFFLGIGGVGAPRDVPFGGLTLAVAFSYGRLRTSENRLREVQARMRALRTKQDAMSLKDSTAPEQKPA